jgi:hypothetical protein
VYDCADVARKNALCHVQRRSKVHDQDDRASHCSVGAVEARGRVVVRILDQEQKTAGGVGIQPLRAQVHGALA